MKWQEVREQFPDKWLLFAAVGFVGWIIFLRREAIEDLARDRTMKGASL